MKDGKTFYVIAEGRLVNLAAGDGHPAEIMDMSFSLQASAAYYLVKNQGKLTEKLIPLPYEVDQDVARTKLSFMGYEIDTLSEEQRKYLDSWQV
jgi:adenosylhomocysteinase